MGKTSLELPIPPHFDPDRVGEVWPVAYGQRAIDAGRWARRHGIRPAAEDKLRVCLLAIDCQNTFCIPEFELFVAGPSGHGAVKDNVRLCQFIYRNLGRITQIVPTMDTHTAMQIFHSVFLVDENGEHPAPMTSISPEDIQGGRWKVNPAVAPSVARGSAAELQDHLVHYCRKLAERNKYQLMIWPYHAMLGGIGHALVSAVEETCFFHNLARQNQTAFQMKGQNPLTENYSVFQPEIIDDVQGKAIARKNTSLVERLLGFDMIIIAGQAKSHCVAWSVDDLLSEIQTRDPTLAGKVYLLEDCTSPVVVPGLVDFTGQAEDAFERFAKAGMHLVRSTDSMDQWR